MGARYLIVNADDFGQAPAINRGIIQAHEQGVVTSTSLMVRWPDAEEAAHYARARHDLSVGLHIDLGEWYVEDGTWKPLYLVVPDEEEATLEAEVSRQLERFGELVGREPSHLDSHQHVHLNEPLHSVVVTKGKALGVPVRSCEAGVIYEGGFYGQLDPGEPFPEGIGFENLCRILEELADGVTELGCHPGGTGSPAPYAAERLDELEVLCDPRLPGVLASLSIRLCNFDTFRQ